MPSSASYASVIKLSGDLVSLQVFAGTQGVSTTDTVRFLGRPMMVSFSDDLLGRVFDGAGVPRDNGPALTENMIPIGGPSVNPAKRIVPKRMIRTGIPMIDVFNTLVESQKLPIFSVSGEPYNQLLARIAMQAEVDVIVLGGMGLKYDDYLFFRDTLEKSGAMGRTVMFVHTASDPTVECTLVPDLSLAVAEQFAPCRQARACAADRHDQLRRRAEGNGHHDGAGAVQPRLPRRPIQLPCLAL